MMNEYNFWRNRAEELHRRCTEAERRASVNELAYKGMLVVACAGWAAFVFAVGVKFV